MVKLYEEFKERGFVVLAVDVREKKETVKKFVEKNKLPFPVLLDTEGKVSNKYGIRAHPDHFIIDGQGKMLGKALGGKDWASIEVRKLIRFLVEKNQEI